MLVVTAQLVTLLLALAGYFFDFVKKDAHGNKQRTSFGLPILTGYGVFAVILAVASNGLAYWKTSTDADNAAERNAELTRKYNELKTQSDALSKNVDTQFDSQLKKQQAATNNIISEFKGATQETLDKLRTATDLQVQSLHAAQAIRLSQFPISRISLRLVWPKQFKAWSVISAPCLVDKPKSVVAQVFLNPGKPTYCTLNSGYGPYDSAKMTSDGTKIITQQLEGYGVALRSPPFEKTLDFGDTSKLEIILSPEQIILSMDNPGVSMDWLATRGLWIRIDREEVRPPKIEIGIWRADFPYIVQETDTFWKDAKTLEKHETGPYPIYLDPYLTRNLEASKTQPSQNPK